MLTFSRKGFIYIYSDGVAACQIHWPISYEAVEDPERPGFFIDEPQKDGQFMLDYSVSLVDTWKTMIDLQKSGKVNRSVCSAKLLLSLEFGCLTSYSLGVSNSPPNSSKC